MVNVVESTKVNVLLLTQKSTQGRSSEELFYLRKSGIAAKKLTAGSKSSLKITSLKKQTNICIELIYNKINFIKQKH